MVFMSRKTPKLEQKSPQSSRHLQRAGDAFTYARLLRVCGHKAAMLPTRCEFNSSQCFLCEFQFIKVTYSVRLIADAQQHNRQAPLGVVHVRGHANCI